MVLSLAAQAVWAGPTVSQEAFGWSTPEALTSEDAQRIIPVVAANGSRVAVAYVDFAPDDEFGERNSETVVRISSDSGDTWSPPLTLEATPGRLSYWLTTAMSSSSTVVAWQDDSYQPCCRPELKVARLDGTEPAIQRVALSPAPTGTVMPRLAVTGSTYYLVVGDYSGYFFSSSVDDGVTWTAGTKTPVSATPGYGPLPDVAGVGQNVSLFWLDRRDQLTHHEVYRSFSGDGGATWGAPVRVSTSQYRELPPGMASRGNDVVAAWVTVTGDESSILHVAHSADAGATWSPPSVVAELAGSYRYIGMEFARPLVISTAAGFEIYTTERTMQAPRRFVSADGVTWTEAPAPQSSQDWRSAAAGGAFRHIVGHFQRQNGVVAYVRGGPGITLVPVGRAATLVLRKHLTARGTVSSLGESGSCVAQVPYSIERRIGGLWKAAQGRDDIEFGHDRDVAPRSTR